MEKAGRSGKSREIVMTNLKNFVKLAAIARCLLIPAFS